LCDGRAQLLGVDLGDQRSFRRIVAAIVGLDVLALDRLEVIDRDNCCRAILVQPGIRRVAHDAQKPGARVATGITANGAKGSQ
jgi:hypothetical protein